MKIAFPIWRLEPKLCSLYLEGKTFGITKIFGLTNSTLYILYSNIGCYKIILIMLESWLVPHVVSDQPKQLLFPWSLLKFGNCCQMPDVDCVLFTCLAQFFFSSRVCYHQVDFSPIYHQQGMSMHLLPKNLQVIWTELIMIVHVALHCKSFCKNSCAY